MQITNDKLSKLPNEPLEVVNFSNHGQIDAVHFSKYEWSQDVVLLTLNTKIITCRIVIENTITVDHLHEYALKDVNNATLSPKTNLSGVPLLLKYAYSDTEFNVCILESDFDNETLAKLCGHSDFINDINYDRDETIASASDDKTVRIWNTVTRACEATLSLTSPGISTQWHREDSKLLVAEKSGIIRFYNVLTQCPILSLDCCKMLSDVHWSPHDPRKIASLAMGELKLWDITRPSQAEHTKLIYTEYGGKLRFSQEGDYLVLVNNLEDLITVLHVPSKSQQFSKKYKLLSNANWHFRAPLVCAASDNSLYFWKM